MLIARADLALAEGGQSSPLVGEVVEGRFHLLEGDPFDGPVRSGDRRSLEEVRLLSPTEPTRTFAVLGGFFPADEPRPDVVPDPMLTPKIARPTAGPQGSIVHPSFVETVVSEAEMAVVIGREIRYASSEAALEAIWGYTCFNDVSAAEYFPQYYLAKGIDTFAAMGPWVRTDISPEQVRAGLEIVGRVNGQTKNSGNTRHFKHMPWDIVAYLSRFLTLSPGDVITLGTPPPPPQARPGDEIEVEVESIGVLTNHVVAEPTRA